MVRPKIKKKIKIKNLSNLAFLPLAFPLPFSRHPLTHTHTHTCSRRLTLKYTHTRTHTHTIRHAARCYFQLPFQKQRQLSPPFPCSSQDRAGQESPFTTTYVPGFISRLHHPDTPCGPAPRKPNAEASILLRTIAPASSWNNPRPPPSARPISSLLLLVSNEPFQIPRPVWKAVLSCQAELPIPPASHLIHVAPSVPRTLPSPSANTQQTLMNDLTNSIIYVQLFPLQPLKRLFHSHLQDSCNSTIIFFYN